MVVGMAIYADGGRHGDSAKEPLCTLSYFIWQTKDFKSMQGFTALTSISGLAMATRKTKRPMRPKPLMPMAVGMAIDANGLVSPDVY